MATGLSLAPSLDGGVLPNAAPYHELLDQALAAEGRQEGPGQTALETLFALGDAMQARHPHLLPEDWLARDCEAHDDVRFAHLFPGG